MAKRLTTEEALAALTLFREDSERKALVLPAVETRRSRILRQTFARHFDQRGKDSEPA